MKDGLGNLQDVFAVDAAHIKANNIIVKSDDEEQHASKPTTGVVLAICGKGAANESVLLGFCIGQSESKELILLFLAFLADNGIVIDQPQYTVLGDRGSAIVAALGDALITALFMYCEQHLKRNLKGQDFKATDDLLGDYSAIVNAVTEDEFIRRMDLLKVKCPQMHTYLSNVDPTGNWVLWKAIQRGNRLMGVHSDNMVETILSTNQQSSNQ